MSLALIWLSGAFFGISVTAIAGYILRDRAHRNFEDIVRRHLVESKAHHDKSPCHLESWENHLENGK